jgi:ParB family chromosome partitioning protein
LEALVTTGVQTRKAGKGARRTGNRFTKFAGGDDSSQLLAAAQEVGVADDVSQGEEEVDSGITAGLASIAAADGQKIIEVDAALIAPHPYNSPKRSAPQPGNEKWDELVASVGASGVQIPVLLVTRASFVAARPTLEERIGPDAQWVTIYGHRRHAATLAAGRATIRAVVDDEVLVDGGDLDAMTLENLGREDLSDLEQGEMFAHYSEAGMGQREIAEKLGLHQSTVSRKMKLLLLAPAVQEAQQLGKIKLIEAVELAKELPYGPGRPWQDSPDAEQNSELRRIEQTTAYELITTRGLTASRAVERVVAERRARARAATEGVEIVDPRTRFGTAFRSHEVESPAAAQGRGVVAAIDPTQGSLIYYSTEPAATETPANPSADAAATEQPSKPAAPPKDRKEGAARAAATKARRMMCPKLVSSVPARERLLAVLAEQCVTGVAGAANSTAGWDLAFQFGRSAELATADVADVEAYRLAASTERDLKRQLEIAWTCAVAGFELHAAAGRQAWGRAEQTYLDLLSERAGYEMTDWERQQLRVATIDQDQ